MRRYQRQCVNELARLYQSKDPLKWVWIGMHLGSNRMPSERERKLLIRRTTKVVKQTAENLVAGMTAFAAAVRGMGVSLKQMAENIQANMKQEESA